jgi:hypothetical protein
VNLTRRAFFVSATAGALPLIGAPAEFGILVTPAQADRLRGASIPEPIHRNAAAALKAGPWTVTSHRPDNVSAEPNDYYSEGPYWWPDPKNPNGPYIRKDGLRNPGRFQANRRDLGDMCGAVLSLGMGAFLLNDKACGDHAAQILSTWFVDSKTRMNPNLEFGQAVRGINTGRGTGLIDTVSLIQAAQGIWLLDRAGMLSASVGAPVRGWYADFLKWMTTSKKGLDEKESGNNHATWWTAQAAAYSSLTHNSALQSMAWDHYRKVLVPGQIQPNGSCPREEARTNSLSYSAMNLDAFSVICRIAQVNSVAPDLWSYRTAKGTGVVTAFNYLAPFILHPESWKKEQISRFDPDGTFFMGLAGAGLRSGRLSEGYLTLPRSGSAWIQFLDLLIKAG